MKIFQEKKMKFLSEFQKMVILNKLKLNAIILPILKQTPSPLSRSITKRTMKIVAWTISIEEILLSKERKERAKRRKKDIHLPSM